jgi:hypothetical protein
LRLKKNYFFNLGLCYKAFSTIIITFFRFYKNGTFIYALIKADKPDEATFKKILEWFNIGSPSVNSGVYQLKNSVVEFSISTPFGDRFIDYKGKVSGKKLTFEVLNHNTGKKSKETFMQINIKQTPKKHKMK